MAIRIFLTLAYCSMMSGTSSVMADEANAAAFNELRPYVPTPLLAERFGNDIKPLANYVKALQKRTAELLAKETPPGAKGLLVAVGIKSKTKTRIWCQAVEGDVPDELLRRLEKELAKVGAVELRKAPAGFAMEINLFGRKADKFPEFPDAWIEAAKKSDATVTLVPPDELFKMIWPD
jgi:hypothetical protein